MAWYFSVWALHVLGHGGLWVPSDENPTDGRSNLCPHGLTYRSCRKPFPPDFSHWLSYRVEDPVPIQFLLHLLGWEAQHRHTEPVLTLSPTAQLFPGFAAPTPGLWHYSLGTCPTHWEKQEAHNSLYLEPTKAQGLTRTQPPTGVSSLSGSREEEIGGSGVGKMKVPSRLLYSQTPLQPP